MPDTQPISVIYKTKRGLYFSVARLLAMTGPEGIRRLAECLAAIVWRLYTKRRILAVTNIRERLGMPEQEAAALARKAFTSNMRSCLECLIVPDYDYRNPDFTVEGQEILDRVHAMDRPVFVITGHLGAWELIAALRDVIMTRGRNGMAVVRRYSDPALNDLMAHLRGSHGVTVVGHRNAVRAILKNQKENGFVSFLVDHHVAKETEAIRLPFLGKETGVNIGPAVLAVRSNTLLLPLAVFRRGNGYCLHVDEYLDPLTLSGTPEEKVRQAAVFYTKAMESLIARAPEQWFWLHNRWK